MKIKHVLGALWDAALIILAVALLILVMAVANAFHPDGGWFVIGGWFIWAIYDLYKNRRDGDT